MIRKNLYLFGWHNFCAGLWLFAALAIIYFEQITGSYALAMLAFSFVNLVQSLSEVPCGIFSDRIGRRYTLLLSSFTIFINMLLWAAAGYYNSMWMLFVGSALRGIGLAFLSGTDTALMYETLAQLKKRKLFDKVFAKSCSYHQIGLVLSAIIATIVTYYGSINILAWLSIIPAFAKIIISWMFVEPKSNLEEGISPWEQVKKSIKLFIKKPKLRRYALLQIINSSLFLAIFRFESMYYEKLVPIYLINIARTLQHIIGCISFWLVPFVRKISFLKLLFLSSLGNAIIRTIGLLMNNALTPFFTATHNFFYGIASTAEVTLIQKEYNKGLRATMDSITALFGGIMIAIFGYAFGAFADYTSPRTAIMFGVGGQVILAIFYHRLFKIYK